MDSAHSKTHRAQPDVLEFYGPRVGPAGDFARPPSKAAQESPCSTRKNRPLLKTLRFYCPALVSFPVLDNNSHHFLVATSEAEQILGAQAFCRSAMSKHMDASLRALCFFYRNPPPGSGVRPQPYKEIAKLIRRPRMHPVTNQCQFKQSEAPHVPIGFGLAGFLMGSAVVPGWFRGGSAADLGWFRGGSGWFRVVPRPNWRLRSKAWARGSATTNLWFLSCFPRILHAAPA